MAPIRGEVLIRRPVEEIFDFVADERNEPSYNPDMLLSPTTHRGRPSGLVAGSGPSSGPAGGG